jgi:cell division protein FtsL
LARGLRTYLLLAVIILMIVTSIGIYQTIIESLKEEIHQLNLKVDQLEKKVDFLTEENTKLRGYGKTL